MIGSAEHHQQKWLFFLKAAKHTIQKTTLNWGTGGHDLCGVVLHGMAVFFEEPGEVFFGSEFILTVVDMHVDVDQHTYTHIDATTSASEIYALSKHALL